MNKQQAEAAAVLMVLGLGERWEPTTWETTEGWQAAAILVNPRFGALIQVIYDPHSGLYTAYVYAAHPEYLGVPPTRKTAKEAVDAAVQSMQTHADVTQELCRLMKEGLR